MAYTFPVKPCIFCRYLSQPQPAVTLEETDHTLTFIPEAVRLEGALLVLSKRHVTHSLELNHEESMDLIHAVRRAALRIEQVFDPDGLNVWWATGILAGQTEPHLHVELVPRHEHIEYRYEDMDQVEPWSMEARIALAEKFKSGAMTASRQG